MLISRSMYIKIIVSNQTDYMGTTFKWWPSFDSIYFSAKVTKSEKDFRPIVYFNRDLIVLEIQDYQIILLLSWNSVLQLNVFSKGSIQLLSLWRKFSLTRSCLWLNLSVLKYDSLDKSSLMNPNIHRKILSKIRHVSIH